LCSRKCLFVRYLWLTTHQFIIYHENVDVVVSIGHNLQVFIILIFEYNRDNGAMQFWELSHKSLSDKDLQPVERFKFHNFCTSLGEVIRRRFWKIGAKSKGDKDLRIWPLRMRKHEGKKLVLEGTMKEISLIYDPINGETIPDGKIKAKL